MSVHVIARDTVLSSLTGGQPADTGTISSPDGSVKFEVCSQIVDSVPLIFLLIIITHMFSLMKGGSCAETKGELTH